MVSSHVSPAAGPQGSLTQVSPSGPLQRSLVTHHRRTPPFTAAVAVLATLLLITLPGSPLYCFPTGAAAAAAAPPNTIAGAAEAAGLTQLSLALNTVGGSLLAAATNPSTAVTVFAPTDEVGAGSGVWF